jgi:hypothetical protein
MQAYLVLDRVAPSFKSLYRPSDTLRPHRMMLPGTSPQGAMPLFTVTSSPPPSSANLDVRCPAHLCSCLHMPSLKLPFVDAELICRDRYGGRFDKQLRQS